MISRVRAGEDCLEFGQPRTWLYKLAYVAVAVLAVEAFSLWGELHREDPLGNLLQVLVVVGSLWLVVGLWRCWTQPFLRLSPEVLEHWPPGQWRGRRLLREEVAGVRKSTRQSVVLDTRGGGRLKIALGFLPKRHRDDARSAIERWVAGSGRA